MSAEKTRQRDREERTYSGGIRGPVAGRVLRKRPAAQASQAREFVIVNVLETEGPMTVRGLGAATGMDQTTIGIHLNALEKAGVLKREQVARPGPKRPAFQWSIA